MRIEDIQRIVMICHGKDCKKAGARKLRDCARERLRDHGLRKNTLIARTHCNGLCKQAPVVCLQPANVWLSQTSPRQLQRAIDDHLAR